MTDEQLKRIILNIDFAIGVIKTCANKDQTITGSRSREPEFAQIINLLEKRKRRAIQLKFRSRV